MNLEGIMTALLRISGISAMSMRDWSTDDLIDKICSVEALVRNPSERRKVTNTLRKFKIDGATLDDGNLSNDVLEQLFDSGIRRRKFKAQVRKWKKELSNVICVRTSNGKTMILYQRQEPRISLSNPVGIVRLYIENVLDVHGGVLTDSRGRHLIEERNFKQNQLRWGDEIYVDLDPKRLPSDVEVCLEQDVITHESSPEFPRAKMACGHGITPQSMTLHIADSLRKYQFDIFCPDSSCQAPWEWATVKKVAALTHREERDFEQQRRQNEEAVLLVTKICPNPECLAPISRNRDVRHSCVRCSMCSQYDICWRCLRRWKSLDRKQCGNEGCDTQILASCDTRDMGANKNVPIVRSCPRCEQLVEHRQACKHVHCSRCSLQFCMSCLKPRLHPQATPRRGWQCGSYGSACPDGVAPKQCSG